MAADTAAAPDVPAHGRSLSLWAGVLGAPAAWGLQLQVGYALVPWVCRTHHYWVLHAVTLGFVLLAALGGWLSYRDWQAAGRGSPDETDGGATARTRFLGALGMVTCGLFALLIIAQGVASFFLDACWL